MAVACRRNDTPQYSQPGHPGKGYQDHTRCNRPPVISAQLTFVGALDVAQKHYRKGTIALTAAQSLIEELHGKGKDLPDRLIQALASARNALYETDFNTMMAEASGYSIDDLITLLQSV
jgi:hypothetical protein